MLFTDCYSCYRIEFSFATQAATTMQKSTRDMDTIDPMPRNDVGSTDRRFCSYYTRIRFYQTEWQTDRQTCMYVPCKKNALAAGVPIVDLEREKQVCFSSLSLSSLYTSIVVAQMESIVM